MAVPAYDIAKLSKNLVEKYSFKRETADGVVSTTHEMVEGATQDLVSKEHFDAKMEVMSKDIETNTAQIEELKSDVKEIKSDVADLKAAVADLKAAVADMKAELKILSKDMRLQLVYAVLAVVALMRGLDWLFKSLG